MAHHESRLHRADDIDEAELVIIGEPQRIVAEIERDQIVHPQSFRRLFRLRAAGRLDALQRHVLLLPELGGFAALAKGEADDRYLITLRRMKRDGSTTAPHEIGSMRADHQRGLLLSHQALPELFLETQCRPECSACQFQSA